MKAVILAAGRGIRMGDLTMETPKPMLRLHGKPILECIIEGLKLAQATEILLIVGYKREVIENFFGTGYKFGVNIKYIFQEKQKGTGHAALLAEKFCGTDKFLLLYADVLVSYGIYREVVQFRETEEFALVANPTEDPYKGGAIFCEGDYVTDIIEKPPKGTSKSKLNNSGIYLFSTKIFELLKKTPKSNRGEIELTEAIREGILNHNLKFRLVKVKKHQIRKDLGDIKDYYELIKNASWLKKMRE